MFILNKKLTHFGKHYKKKQINIIDNKIIRLLIFIKMKLRIKYNMLYTYSLHLQKIITNNGSEKVILMNMH